MMLLNRRLVNLAMTDNKNHIFSLHRMDLSKLLFYPSTAEAEAIGGKGEPPELSKLQLPPPIMGFQPFPASSDPFLSPLCGMFALLHGHCGRSGDGEPSRIFFTSSEGQTSMYDVDSRCVISVPDLRVHTRFMDTTIVTGAGAGTGEERLYMMRSGGPFEVLDFSGGGGGCEKSRTSTFSRDDRSGSLLWEPLPPAPKAIASIRSFTVVDGGRIICVSSSASSVWTEDDSTFCFDTESQEWWRAGDWILPFEGRAVHVPELDTWLGFSSDHPHHLCAVDLSGVAMAPRQAPTPRHVWEDYEPPPEEETSLVLNKDYPGIALTRSVDWAVIKLFLVNMGSGRFCVAKVVRGEESVSLTWPMADTIEKPMGTFTVLTGVEVIRGSGDGEDELRMIKHKSRRLVHPGLAVAYVL